MKITFVNKPAYAEESQPNPIRWAILSGTPEAGFKNETAWMKCKDFFNDVVYTINTGKPMAIYGFDTSKMVLPKKGEPLYVAVKDTTKGKFLDNLSTVFYEMDRDLNRSSWTGRLITDEEGLSEEPYILEINPELLANTYNISLFTLMVRLCNVDHCFKSWEEFKNYKQFPQKDQAKWDVVVAKGVFFNLPEGLSKYIWFASSDYHSEKEVDSYQIPGLVHNGGVLTYTRAM